MSEPCEECERTPGEGPVSLAVAYFGWDNTPLCEQHLAEAERNYEAATQPSHQESE